MKVLVTGATGFIGKQLLHDLRDNGHDIVVLTRDPQTARARLPVLCDVFPWDPEHFEPPQEAFQEVQAIVHLAGAGVANGRWTTARKEKIKLSRVRSTYHIVQAIKKLACKPETFISASAIGYYGKHNSSLLSEDAPPSSEFLGEVCQEWENQTLKAKTLNIRTLVLRLAFVIGRESLAMNRMLPVFRLGLGGRLGSGKQPMSWIHVKDATGIILHALGTPSMHGIYNSASPNTVSNEEFTQTLTGILKRPAIFPIPAFALKIALGEMSQLLLDGPNVSVEKVLSTGYKVRYVTLPEALKEVCDNPYHKFQMEQWIPYPQKKVFEFFCNAENLETITPKFLHFKVLSAGKINKGAEPQYRLCLHGVPIFWKSKITEWRPNTQFTDIQTKGPYAYWEHNHEFAEKNGGTLMRDTVTYRLPFGPAGDIVAGNIVRLDLEKIFTYRRDQIEKIFSAQNKKGNSVTYSF